jgi:hypothetical protein
MGQVVKAQADGHCVTMDTWVGSTKRGREYGDLCIADCYDEGHPDNTESRATRYAKRIARALNAHDAMRASLEELLDLTALMPSSDDAFHDPELEPALERARAAIAEAKGSK